MVTLLPGSPVIEKDTKSKLSTGQGIRLFRGLQGLETTGFQWLVAWMRVVHEECFSGDQDEQVDERDGVRLR